MFRDVTFTDVSRTAALHEDCASFVMDEDAFRAFYDRTARGIWAYLVRVTGNRQLADDLLQETFYRFLRAAAAHDSEAHRRNSLYRIATNLARDARRRNLFRPSAGSAGDDIERVAAGGDQAVAAERAYRFRPRHVASEAARAGDVMAGLRRGRFASRDRGCAGPASRQLEDPVVSRAAEAGRASGEYGMKRLLMQNRSL